MIEDRNADLIEEAKLYWNVGCPVPLDLSATMIEAGLNVRKLEAKYLKQED